MIERCAGKYLGIVADNHDPKSLARIRVRVPEVFGEEMTGWCIPCSPYAGPNIGLAAVPPVGSLVFVEWTAGDTTRLPIWSGGMWPDGDGIDEAGPDAVALVTPGGHRIVLDDTDGNDRMLRIRSASGARITLDDNGVAIQFGTQKIVMTGTSIEFNDGAMVIK